MAIKLKIFLIIVITLILATYLYACAQQPSNNEAILPSTSTTTSTSSTSTSLDTTTTTTSTTSTTQQLYPGPAVGESGNNADQVFRSLSINPSSPETIYLGSEGNGIFKSIDGGQNWTWSRNGLIYNTEAETYPEIYDLAIHPTDSDIIYAATNNGLGPATGNYPSAMAGLYESIDGGSTWRQVTITSESNATEAIKIDTSNPAIFYASIHGGTLEAGNLDIDGQFFPGGIFKSVNSGESWTKLDLPANSEINSYTIIRIGDTSSIFTLGTNTISNLGLGLIKSTDSGDTWTTINPEADCTWTSFDISPLNQELIYIGAATYLSQNGGDNWSAAGIDASVIRLSSLDENLLLYAVNRELRKRTTHNNEDGTLVLTADNDIADIEYHPTNANIIYFSCNGLLVYKSVDGGNSFEQVANLREFIDNY
ncbi:MAG: hypothetical protein ABH823_03065 [bacterium]